MEGREPEATGETADSNTSSSASLPSRIEVRPMPQHGVELDGVWITMEFLEQLAEQGVYDSQFWSSLGAPDRRTQQALERRGLLERETRGGVHRSPALVDWMQSLTWPERADSVSSPPEAEPPVPADGRPFRKFHVGPVDDDTVWIRCRVCGVGGVFGLDGDAVGLEELTAWAEAHECPRMRPEDAPPGGFRHAHPDPEGGE